MTSKKIWAVFNLEEFSIFIVFIVDWTMCIVSSNVDLAFHCPESSRKHNTFLSCSFAFQHRHKHVLCFSLSLIPEKHIPYLVFFLDKP